MIGVTLLCKTDTYLLYNFQNLLTMFKLSYLYSNIIKKAPPTQCGITCEIIDPTMAKLNQLLTESVACFCYTLVTRGKAVINYDGKITTLDKNNLFVYTPGMMIKTLDTSDDYEALCLIGDEAVTYEIPYARNVVRASYFPGTGLAENKIILTDCESEWLKNRLKEIHKYTHSQHIYRDECLYSLYSVFILDLLNVESRFNRSEENNSHTVDLYLRFVRLLTANFINKHDIAFYAEALAVTTIYLSRIVKKYSGQTVKNHIDRMVAMEAAYLLRSTDMSISSIAMKLNFANPSSFCKFFVRNKGCSPRKYRESASVMFM